MPFFDFSDVFAGMCLFAKTIMNTSAKKQSEYERFAGMPKSIEHWKTRNTKVLSRKTTSKKIENLKGKLRQAGSCSPPKACWDLIAALNVTSN